MVDRIIWDKVLPLKISFFEWRPLHDFLPLDDNLKRRGIVLSSQYVCCEKNEELLNHLFLHGPVATQVWRHFVGQFSFLNLDLLQSTVSAMFTSWVLL